MCFINKNRINTQFLKSDYIILIFLINKLVQLCFKALSCTFNLFNRPVITILRFNGSNRIKAVLNLTANICFLSFLRNWYFFKLTCTNNYSIIVTSCDFTNKSSTTIFFKILLSGKKNISIRIQCHKFISHLICQMIWYNNKWLIRQPKPS